MENLLLIEGLSLQHEPGGEPPSPLLEEVNLSVSRGGATALVGQSGSGKTLTALAVMGLLPRAITVVAGRITLDGKDVLGSPEYFRGRDIAMVFQEPSVALNPTWPVGVQIADVVRQRLGVDRRKARQEALSLLERVGIPKARQRSEDPPGRFSVGQLQRILIAMALACQPRLLLADEPTSALDVTIGNAILDLLRELQEERELGILLITHDFRAVNRIARNVAVMRNGSVVEQGGVEDVIERPGCDYTRQLLAATPGGPR